MRLFCADCRQLYSTGKRKHFSTLVTAETNVHNTHKHTSTRTHMYRFKHTTQKLRNKICLAPKLLSEHFVCYISNDFVSIYFRNQCFFHSSSCCYHFWSCCFFCFWCVSTLTSFSEIFFSFLVPFHCNCVCALQFVLSYQNHQSIRNKFTWTLYNG